MTLELSHDEDGRVLVNGKLPEDMTAEDRAAFARVFEPLAARLGQLADDERGMLAALEPFAAAMATLNSSYLEAPPPEAHGFTERQIRVATARVRKRERTTPTREQVARDLHTSASNLDRAMEELRMPPWPPAAPDD